MQSSDQREGLPTGSSLGCLSSVPIHCPSLTHSIPPTPRICLGARRSSPRLGPPHPHLLLLHSKPTWPRPLRVPSPSHLPVQSARISPPPGELRICLQGFHAGPLAPGWRGQQRPGRCSPRAGPGGRPAPEGTRARRLQLPASRREKADPGGSEHLVRVPRRPGRKWDQLIHICLSRLEYKRRDGRINLFKNVISQNHLAWNRLSLLLLLMATSASGHHRPGETRRGPSYPVDRVGLPGLQTQARGSVTDTPGAPTALTGHWRLLCRSALPGTESHVTLDRQVKTWLPWPISACRPGSCCLVPALLLELSWLVLGVLQQPSRM